MVAIWTGLSRIVSLTEDVTFFFLAQHSSTTKLFPAGIIVEILITEHFQMGIAK